MHNKASPKSGPCLKDIESLFLVTKLAKGQFQGCLQRNKRGEAEGMDKQTQEALRRAHGGGGEGRAGGGGVVDCWKAKLKLFNVSQASLARDHFSVGRRNLPRYTARGRALLPTIKDTH